MRATPIVLLLREQAALWQSEPDQTPELSATASTVLDALRAHGASFFVELVDDSGMLRSQVETALGELVSHGLVTSDGFAGLRALVAPAELKARRLRRGGARAAFENLESAGRWSLVRTRRQDGGNDVEAIAWLLLRRYGVLFRRLIERETRLPPWRELHYALRRLEARGEIRGGRFVSGFAGEQFALLDVPGALNKQREDRDQALVVLAGCDPLNLSGSILPGERVPALPGHRLLLRGGVPVATLIGGEERTLVDTDSATQWQWRNRLLRGSTWIDEPNAAALLRQPSRTRPHPHY